MSSSEGENPRNDAVTGTDVGTSFVQIRSSVKSAIKALSGSRFGTTPSGTNKGAAKTDRDLTQEFGDLGQEAIPNAALNNGAEKSDRDLAREFYLLKYPDELPLGDSEMNVRRGDRRRSVQDIRLEYGGTEVGGDLKSEGGFGPAMRPFFGSPAPVFVPALSAPNAQLDLPGCLPHADVMGPRVGSHVRPSSHPDSFSFRPGQIETYGTSRTFAAQSPFHEVLPLFHPGIGTYGTYCHEEASEMGHSTRYGRDDTRNVTSRDNKRPKERSRDRVYKTRFSMDASMMPNSSFPILPLGGNVWPREEGIVDRRPVVSAVYGPGRPPGSPLPPPTRENSRLYLSPQAASFEVELIYEGRSVLHRVWPNMPIAQLMMDAGAIFGLDSREIVLLLFSASPVSLHKDGSISGPPAVLPGAKVLVVTVHGQPPTGNPAGLALGHRTAPE
jgi:hypothetical protein